MEEEKIVIEEATEELEVQTTFNTDSINVLVEDGEVENVDAPEPEGIGADEVFTMRTSKPGAGNKFFMTKSKGGYSTCIKGSPTDANCDVLANCVGYACGRFNEIIGTMKYPSLNCNAENFIERAKNTYGLKISDVPTLGGIMVWQKGDTLNGGDGAGHVAVVEKIIDSNTIYTSESGYGSSAFWNSTRSNSNGRWGLGSGYKFRGCIVNPNVNDVTPVPETDNTNGYTGKYKIGDKVVISGNLYISSKAKNPSGSVKDKVTTITRIAENTAHPYNTTGDLGWINEADIKLYEEPKPEPTPTPEPTPEVKTKLEVGDTVKIIATGNGSSYGDSNTAYGIGWERQILKIYDKEHGYKEDRPFPYRVGNKTGTTGFYKESALQKK